MKKILNWLFLKWGYAPVANKGLGFVVNIEDYHIEKMIDEFYIPTRELFNSPYPDETIAMMKEQSILRLFSFIRKFIEITICDVTDGRTKKVTTKIYIAIKK